MNHTGKRGEHSGLKARKGRQAYLILPIEGDYAPSRIASRLRMERAVITREQLDIRGRQMSGRN